MRKIHTLPRIAVIGAGAWGKNLIRNFSNLNSLAAICENDTNTLELIKSDYPDCQLLTGISEVFKNRSIQGVVIATPAESHGRLVREALLAGKDVFVEKPLCLSLDEGRSLVALAKQRQRILMVGHLLWYHPAVLRLKGLIDSGELGRIQYIYSNRINLGKIRREENILWSFAPHDISVILGLLGEMPDK
ncbi:MAG: Gfo/Idh/MocA family oxidoreductase, partial [Nitrospirae bacterium]|nr:Gfo/Idh/MocA family oxidoreductase [Nitrospirota bacterium]